LVVRGDRDLVAPQTWVEAITTQLAKGQLSVIPKSPHCVNYTTPGALTQVVQRFVEEIVKRQPAAPEGAGIAIRLYNVNLSR
jgi:pimeloyl-ACP methyl ester carboxylesterase